MSADKADCIRIGIRTMIAEIRARGGEPAGILVRSVDDWEAMLGPDAPLAFDGLPVFYAPHTVEAGAVFCIGPDLAGALSS